MAFELEQELKVLLTEDQFKQLLLHWQLDNQQPNIKQHNTYYDTTDSALKEIDAALRLRNFKTSSVWTIKHRQNEFQSHEYHQTNPTTLIPKHNIEVGAIYDEQLLRFLSQNAIKIEDLKQTYDIKTSRWLIPVSFGEFALDHSVYSNSEDYELELETTQLIEATTEFKHFIEQFGIQMKQAETKLSRASKYYKLSY